MQLRGPLVGPDRWWSHTLLKGTVRDTLASYGSVLESGLPSAFDHWVRVTYFFRNSFWKCKWEDMKGLLLATYPFRSLGWNYLNTTFFGESASIMGELGHIVDVHNGGFLSDSFTSKTFSPAQDHFLLFPEISRSFHFHHN
jgi:hypothetical protein